ncbi:AbfB domain-containing protein [Streptomyces plumbiresistens]|uniref:Alpha-L-arabinofuranosidase B arabinose-binding domain-containing protein n=1 Tax=Streptomyces plumbiresistens TaxID=511811 RepID=A0ABP7TYW1_9ACTN
MAADGEFNLATNTRLATHRSDVLPDCDCEGGGAVSSTFNVDGDLDFYLAPVRYGHTNSGGDVATPGSLAAAFAAGPVGGIALMFGLAGIVADPLWAYELRDGRYGKLSASLAGAPSKFKSHNIPEHYIRHRNFLGEISPDGQPADDFKFTIVHRGSDLVALKSVNFPDRYLRHQNSEIKLHASAGPDDAPWRQDSTFQMITGLADPAGISFRSTNYPDRFVRHRNFRLYIEPADSPLARPDATFYRIKA